MTEEKLCAAGRDLRASTLVGDANWNRRCDEPISWSMAFYSYTGPATMYFCQLHRDALHFVVPELVSHRVEP